MDSVGVQKACRFLPNQHFIFYESLSGFRHRARLPENDILEDELLCGDEHNDELDMRRFASLLHFV